MKLKVNRKELEKALALSVRVIDRKATIPILYNILLTAEYNTLKLTSTDLESGLTLEVPAQVEKAGRITVSGNKFNQLIKSLKDEVVEISIPTKGWVSVKTEDAEFKFVGIPVEDFPELPVEHTSIIHIGAPDFLEMIKKVGFAISEEDSRYALNGAEISVDEVLRLVGTDGHRMAVAETEHFGLIEQGDTTESFKPIIPYRSLQILPHILKGQQDIWIGKGDKHLFFEGTRFVFCCQILEGQFPKWRKVVPIDSFTVDVLIPKQELTEAIKQVVNFASSRSGGLKLYFARRGLTIYSSDLEYGEAKKTLKWALSPPCPKFEIGINYNFLITFCNVVKGDMIRFQAMDEVSQMLFTSPDDPDYKYVVMPMRI